MLYNFPQVIGLPNRIEVNKESFYKIINSCNKLKHLYFQVDRSIFFDFDNDNCLDETMRLHELLLKKDLKHLMLWSGGGCHLHILCDKKPNKETLKNIHLNFINNLKLDIDWHIVGDDRRLGRIPNTYNIKRKCYCIPISNEDILRGKEFIINKAQNQNFDFTIYGNKKLIVGDYYKEEQDQRRSEIKLSYEITAEINKDDFLKGLPVCMSHLLLQGDMGWRERMHVILYLRDTGFLRQEVEQLLKHFLSKEKYEHCIFEERQVKYLFSRTDFFISTCKTLKQEGYCVKGCDYNMEKVYL